MVKIVADTTACLREDFLQKHPIPVIPQVINFGNESFLEGEDIDNATFMARLRTSSVLPKTAAPLVESFTKVFKELVPLGEPILCIHPSADVSGTVRSALTAAQEFPEAQIRVLDTRLVSSPLATLVELAVAWAEAGVDADTIEKRVMEMAPRCRIYFLVATLEYLAKGGRIGGASALLGSVLQIKPILTFTDGKVDQLEKARTMKTALARLKELVTDQYPRSGNGYLTVMHGGVPDQGQELASELGAALGLENVPVHDMPPAIVVNAGPGVLGVGFFV